MNGKPVRVLVVVARRHGATAEIGAAVARDLGDREAGRAAGLVAMALPLEQRPDPAPVDAVTLPAHPRNTCAH
jgi:menaquinone-dependent protoporphyrinogen oxidase